MAATRKRAAELKTPPSWEDIYRAVRVLAPPPVWRQTLADGLRALTGHPTIVRTCAPGNWLQAEAAHSPIDIEEAATRIYRDFLPKLAREGGWQRYMEQGNPVATNPEIDPLLVSKQAHERVLKPLGWAGFVLTMAFLPGGELPVGWVVLWCAEPQRVCDELRLPLQELARVMGQHIGGVLDLARGFGVQASVGGWQDLSSRELQIALLVSQGNSNLNVANQVGIAESTVAVHLRRIYRKLGVHSRTQLTRAVMVNPS